ncbi:MAG: hypothetical protein PUJ72_03480 [Eubacteriales bacterium]|nr:hypothetical protein [Eubacteriales bacterium]MCI6971700.1 hypothetical protein [Eubacterium sp.]MDD7573295.1 hypothetical protein [Eubacteriales bacterium]
MKLRMVQMFFNAYKEERNLLHWVMKESSFLADSIVLGLWKETFFDCSKINFVCKDGDLCEDVRDIGNNIADLDVPFSRDYFDMNVEERQKYLAETFRIATKMWCDKKGWDYSLFKAVIDKVEEDNYIVNRNFRVRCRNGDMNAKLVGIQSIDSMDLYVDIYRKRTFERREFIFSVEPNIFAYGYITGSLVWEGDKISLLNASKKLVASIKV